MNSLKDLLQKKADSIDDSKVRDDLQLLQSELDRYFDGNVKVERINQGKAIVSTSNAGLASELRMRQHALLEDVADGLRQSVQQFIIRIS